MLYLLLLGLDRAVKYIDRLNMPYTEAVLLETLRKGNIASTALPHSADKDLVINGVVSTSDRKLIL